jgi:hypothetical protein
MKWKVRYQTYARHGESDTIIEVVECENEMQCMNAILELVRDLEEEVESLEDFIGEIENCDGDDRVIYVYDLTNKEFIYEE